MNLSRTYQIALALAITLVTLLATSTTNITSVTSANAATIRDIIFPIDGSSIDQVRWSDTYGAPRSHGGHKGVDILGRKGIPMIAAADGVISWGKFNNSSGNSLMFKDSDGWQYWYVHFNNDTPGTDDKKAKCTQVYTQKICSTVQANGKLAKGTPVKAGEVLGYMGDSGNAEATPPHLHFEIRTPGGTAINPTASVNVASRINALPIGDQTLQRAQLNRLYVAIFNRAPDTDGSNYWTEKMQKGYTLEDIAEIFADSEEFKTKYSNVDFSTFLDRLYVNTLGRTPDLAGKNYWLLELSNGSVDRGTIVVQFSESAEMVSKFN